jgi:hypothetical protein
MGSLKARCMGCHGANLTTLFTFRTQDPYEGNLRVLDQPANAHAQYVAAKKVSLDSWKHLKERWPAN